jgi:transaldolase
MQSSNQLKIKLFADGADFDSIINLSKDDRIKGFTTNPTLMRKSGVLDYKSFAKEILLQIKDKPISFEVFSDDITEMEEQAKEIASWGNNVYVKIPITNTKSDSTLPIINKLSHAGVKVNVTCVFTIMQAFYSALALQNGAPSVISIFAGRIADSGISPIPLMSSVLSVCNSVDKSIELLWASPRELYNIIEADEVGCHIITVAPEILSKLNLIGKDLTEFSLDTVNMFYNDAKKAGYTL